MDLFFSNIIIMLSEISALGELVQLNQNVSTTQNAMKCIPVFTDDARLNNMMNSADYVVIGRDTCPWTLRALEQIRSKNRSVFYLDYTKTSTDLQQRLASFLNYKYVPIIIRKGYFLGGYSELTNCINQTVTSQNPQNDVVQYVVNDAIYTNGCQNAGSVNMSNYQPLNSCTSCNFGKTVPVLDVNGKCGQ